MEFQQYIRTELLILVPVLYLIGLALKKSPLPDKWIPLVLGLVSVALCTAWVLSTGPTGDAASFFAALFTAVTQGVLLAGTGVYANQLYKQAKKDE